MNRRVNRLALAAAILAAVCLAAGCGSAIKHIKHVVSSLASGQSVTVSPPPLTPTSTLPPPHGHPDDSTSHHGDGVGHPVHRDLAGLAGHAVRGALEVPGPGPVCRPVAVAVDP